MLDDEENKADALQDQYISAYACIELNIKNNWFYYLADNPVMYVVDSYKAEGRLALLHLE